MTVEEGYAALSPERISVTKVQLDTKTEDWEGLHSDLPNVSEATVDEVEIGEALVFCRASY